MKICIEGNIGVGKSETLKILKLRGYDVLEEPIESWTLLENFYENKLLAFPFQMQVLSSFAKPFPQTNILFQERSAKSGVRVFSAMLKDDGFLTDLQMSILCTAYLEMNFDSPDLIIYLNLEPLKCLQRIESRNRKNENFINENYIGRVEKYYKEYLDEEDTTVEIIECEEKTPDQIADEIILKIGTFLY